MTATLHGLGVGGAVAVVFVADHGDTGEEETGQKIFAELGRDEKNGRRKDGLVNPAIDSAVAVESDKKSGTVERRAGGEDVDTGKVETGAELGEALVPKVWHEKEFTVGRKTGTDGVGGE